MRFPLAARTLATVAVMLCILVPIDMIRGKVSEREARARGVVEQFAAETSGPQRIAGPLLALTCEESFVEERTVMRNGKAETVSEKRTGPCPTAYFAPRELKATANLPVESRRRGIYPIRVYRADVEMAAEFAWPAEPPPNGMNPRRWKEAWIVSSMSDPRGVQSITSSLPGGVQDGKGDAELERFTLRQRLGPASSRAAGELLPVSLLMRLVGTTSLHVAPLGDRTTITLRSDWPHPAFGTQWSPDSRAVSSKGFEATWKLTGVATGGSAPWVKAAGEGKLAAAPAAGVSLIDPVNPYALSYRATEYAFLFVLLTFAALALTEVLAGVRMHLVQYGLVGCAIAVFFLLLLALSEHVPFGWAYGAASAACVALLTFYLRHPLATRTRTAIFGALFTALYGCLYVLLRSEDHALLLGSVLVFAVLAIAMGATRKVDWAALSARMSAPEVPGPAFTRG